VSDRQQTERDDRQAQREQARDDRLAQRDEAREDWQDYGEELQEDRQDFWDDELDDIDGVWVGGWGHVHLYDEDDFLAGMAVLAIGSALTAAAFSSMQQKSGCQMTPVDVEGAAYYYCEPHWYARALDGGTTTYVVVQPPPGY
jgi:hypothetical protein